MLKELILLFNLTKSKLENGFTLIEMLVVLFILSVLFSISAFGASCYIKSTDYKENYSNAKIVQTSILNYASSHENSYPLGDLAKSDKLVMDSLFNAMGNKLSNALKSDSIYKHFVFNIDSSKIKIGNKLKNSDINDYYIFYVDEKNSNYNIIRKALIDDGVTTEEKVDSLLKSFNGTVLFKDFMDTCFDDNLDNFVSGKSLYNDVSEGLKFEISDDFIDCPNGGICSNSNTSSN